jgi:ribosomal 30S subunit maturation factor RimM
MKNIMHNGTRTEKNQHGGDYNMYEGYKKFNKDEYREFESWIQANNQELYENKIAYEVCWKEDEYYYVKLCDESIYTLNDILLDINQGIV